jgi:hypothetical protein
VHVEGHVVAVETVDHLDGAVDARRGGHPGLQRGEQRLESLLGRRYEVEQRLDRGVWTDGHRFRRIRQPERLHRRDHARVGARIVA